MEAVAFTEYQKKDFLLLFFQKLSRKVSANCRRKLNLSNSYCSIDWKALLYEILHKKAPHLTSDQMIGL